MREAEPLVGAQAPYLRVAAPAAGPSLISANAVSLKEPLPVSSLGMNAGGRQGRSLPLCSQQMLKASLCQACF